jgi:hypothetical protein
LPRAAFILAACLWLAASAAQALAWDPGVDFLLGRSPADLFSCTAAAQRQDMEAPEPDPHFELRLERPDLSPFRPSFLPHSDDLNNELRGVTARYQIGGWIQNGIEISGGYFPSMKPNGPAKPWLDSGAYLGYVNLRIPLYRFSIGGGAFYGQNMDLLNLIGQPSPEDPTRDSELFGYQITGGYRFSDSLSLRAGWGQTGQGREMTREDLRTWYVQAQISLGLQISVTPQMGFVDFIKGDGEKAREEAFYCGARWQISF